MEFVDPKKKLTGMSYGGYHKFPFLTFGVKGNF